MEGGRHHRCHGRRQSPWDQLSTPRPNVVTMGRRRHRRVRRGRQLTCVAVHLLANQVPAPQCWAPAPTTETGRRPLLRTCEPNTPPEPTSTGQPLSRHRPIAAGHPADRAAPMCRYEMFHIDTKKPGNARLATLGTGPSEQYPASATTLGGASCCERGTADQIARSVLTSEALASEDLATG